MSDIHILSGDGKGRWNVIFHFAVADANNAVSVNYRTALVNSGFGGTTSMTEGVGAGQISTAEKAQVEAGELYEYGTSLLVETGGTAALELQAMIRAEYTRLNTQIINDLQKRLKYFGHTESQS